MACSAIATARARLVTGLEETVRLIFVNPAGITAHAALLDRLLVGAGFGNVWHSVYDAQVTWSFIGGRVQITADGLLRVYGGSEATIRTVSKVFESYGALLVQARAKVALGALGKITGEQRLPSGAVVLNLEV